MASAVWKLLQLGIQEKYWSAWARFWSERTTSKYWHEQQGFWDLGLFLLIKKPKETNHQNQPPLLEVFVSSHTHLIFLDCWGIWVGIHFPSLFLWCVKHSLWEDPTCLCSLCSVTVPPLAAEGQNGSPFSGFDLLVFVPALPGAGWNLLHKGKSAEWSTFHWFLNLTANGEYGHSQESSLTWPSQFTFKVQAGCKVQGKGV